MTVSVARGRARRRSRDLDGSVLRWPGAQQRFALFAEVLWTGVLMAIVCVPVITWPAAVAAGCAHLRRYLYAEATPASEFFRDVRRALPGSVGVGAATSLLAALVAFDLVLVAGGPAGAQAAVPGGVALAIAISTIGVVVAGLAVVAASLWSPGTPWRSLVRAAVPVARADVSGAGYTIVALGMAAVITWQFLPLVIPALGMLAFALVAIGERRLARLTAAATLTAPPPLRPV